MALVECLFLVFGMQTAHAQLPPDAVAMLKKLPEQKLSVELVVAKAYLSSDSLRAVKAQALAVDTSYWLAQTPLASQLYFSGTYSKNENRFASIFEPKDSKLFVVGASKYFTTGTLLGVEINELQTTLPPANVFQPPNEATAKVTLSQNLWKDAFGNMTRNQVQAGKTLSEGSRLAVHQSVQDWTLNLIQVYYGAWFSKSQLTASKTNLDRRKRLLNVTKLKASRGTAERPDYLQVESALLQSKAAYEQARQDLQQTWRELVTSLKLPDAWMELPAEHIPLALDEPAVRAAALCAKNENFTTSTERSLEQRLWKTRLEASAKLLEASKSAYSPTVALEGSYGSSGTVGEFGDRSSDALSGQNPEWSVGVRFKMPLEWYTEKADLARRASEHEQNLAFADKARTDHLTGWINSCSRLKTLIENRQSLEHSARNLSERAMLEERRFQVGRTTTMNVILAGDDFSNAELQLNQTKIALNRAAWEILKLDGAVEEHLSAVVKKYESLKF